jgi:hypothetical protein
MLYFFLDVYARNDPVDANEYSSTVSERHHREDQSKDGFTYQHKNPTRRDVEAPASPGLLSPRNRRYCDSGYGGMRGNPSRQGGCYAFAVLSGPRSVGSSPVEQEPPPVFFAASGLRTLAYVFGYSPFQELENLTVQDIRTEIVQSGFQSELSRPFYCLGATTKDFVLSTSLFRP